MRTICRLMMNCRHGRQRHSCLACDVVARQEVTIGYAPSTQAQNPEGMRMILELSDELFADDPDL